MNDKNSTKCNEIALLSQLLQLKVPYPLRDCSVVICGISLLGILLMTAFAAGAARPYQDKLSPNHRQAIDKGTISIRALSEDLTQIPPFLRLQPKWSRREVPRPMFPSEVITRIRHRSTSNQYAPPLNPNTNVSSEDNTNHLIKTLTSSTSFGFQGIVAQDNMFLPSALFEPPDQGLAVHDNVVAEINNEALRFYDAPTGTPLTGTIPIATFFNDVLPGGLAPFDPQVFYDSSVNRWYFTADNASLNGIDVAVSKTSNPLGEYRLFSFTADLTLSGTCGGQPGVSPDDCFPDYPKAGYDEHGLFISVDLFNLRTGTIINAATYALPKWQLTSESTPVTVFELDYPNPSSPASSFVVQPSVPAPDQPFVSDANGTEYLMEARLNDTRTIKLWAITNTKHLSTPIPTAPSEPIGVDILVEPIGIWTVTTNQPNKIHPMCSNQGGTVAPTLGGGFRSFQSTIQMAGGSLNQLYGVLPFSEDNDTRNILAWFVINPIVTGTPSVAGTVARQGYIIPKDPNYSLLNPAFGLNKEGTGVLGFSITQPDASKTGGYPSAAIIPVMKGVPGSTIYVTGVGQNSDQGITGCAYQDITTEGRWGDYGAATVDSSTGYFYAANEYIPFMPLMDNPAYVANWGTYITRMFFLSE